MNRTLRILAVISVTTTWLGITGGEHVRGAEPGPRVRPLWDCDTTEGTEGLVLERENVKQGRAAVRWQDHPRVTGFSVPGVPQDWTGFNLLRMWVYNAKPVPARFMILVPSENPHTEGMDYWSYGVRLNFEGWKDLVLPIGGKDGTRSPSSVSGRARLPPASTSEWTISSSRGPATRPGRQPAT